MGIIGVLLMVIGGMKCRSCDLLKHEKNKNNNLP